MYSMNFFYLFLGLPGCLKLLVKLRAVGNVNDSGHESGDPQVLVKGNSHARR